MIEKEGGEETNKLPPIPRTYVMGCFTGSKKTSRRLGNERIQFCPIIMFCKKSCHRGSNRRKVRSNSRAVWVWMACTFETYGYWNSEEYSEKD